MAATERPPLRGASVETRVLAVEDGVGARAPRPPRRRGAARDPRGGPRPGGRARRRHDAHARATTSSSRRASCTREGLLTSRARASSEIKYCTDVELAEQAYNVVTVHLRRPFDGRARAAQLRRHVGLRRVRQGLDRLDRGRLRAARRRARSCRRACIGALPERLRAAQRTFERTGGLHATGLFDGRRRADRSCARTSAATTRSTRSSATACSPARRRSPSSVALVSGRASLRARAEGGGRRASRCCAPSARRRASRSMPHAGSA